MNDFIVEPGIDAVFLPGKIHSCEWQVYIIYFNECADDGKGSFEIEVVDKERIVDLYKRTDGNSDLFFELLSDCFQGEWFYCNRSNEQFNEYLNAYYDADFIFGRDGNAHDEMMFLVDWANKQ